MGTLNSPLLLLLLSFRPLEARFQQRLKTFASSDQLTRTFDLTQTHLCWVEVASALAFSLTPPPSSSAPGRVQSGC